MECPLNNPVSREKETLETAQYTIFFSGQQEETRGPQQQRVAPANRNDLAPSVNDICFRSP